MIAKINPLGFESCLVGISEFSNFTSFVLQKNILTCLETSQVRQSITRHPVTGENHVEKGYPGYTAPTTDQPGRVYINGSQYVDGVPEDVWEFMVGGCQVLGKWLKDRRGRQLSYNDLNHYQQVVVALQRTIHIMDAIDETIPDWPIK